MQITDAHVHFWDLSLMSYPWLEEVPEIKKSFGLSEYNIATKGLPVKNMIFVQCECLPTQYEQEISYITQLAKQDNRIKGIVCYCPLEKKDAPEQLQKLTENKLIKGVRRLEENPVSLYKNPVFIEYLSLLNTYNLTFDIGIKACQLPAAISLVETRPDVKFMLDHLGKPDVRRKDFHEWKNHITILSKNLNVYCKLSGLVTEANLSGWQTSDLKPYVDTIFSHFGTGRVVFGGDWPVVTLASDYHRWYHTALELCQELTDTDLEKIFHLNAIHFYQIEANK